MNQNDLITKLIQLIDSLVFDYDRMSNSGKETYDEICNLIEQLSK